jgi:hypothetical protein
MAFAGELQRDWARTETVQDFGQILNDHGGNVGTSLQWEYQLLNTPVPELEPVKPSNGVPA